MPKIYDNIENDFSSGLKEHLKSAFRVDYCVGYFNIRGWKSVADEIDKLQGAEVRENNLTFKRCCRLLLGMFKTPFEIIEDSYTNEDKPLDHKKILELKGNAVVVGSDEVFFEDMLAFSKIICICSLVIFYKTQVLKQNRVNLFL